MKMDLPNGVTFEEFPDGSIVLTTKVGARLSIDARGQVSADLKAVRNVGLENLLEVQEHSINSLYGSRSHVIKFRDGGFAKFAYSDKGELIELSGHAVGVTLTPENDIIFRGRSKKEL